MNDLTSAALALAAEGIPVFPVGPDKAPRTRRGFHDASTDPDVIRRWKWNDGDGIGAAIPEGMIVVDVDPRNGGNDTMKEHGPMPATRVIKTRSDGAHYYLKVPRGMSLRSTLGAGVDIKRAGKGYVVVPPTDGYAVLMDLEPADAPEWLLKTLYVEEQKGPEFEAHDAKYFPFEDGTAYGLAALEDELKRLAAAPEGERNNTLNRVAFSLAQLVAGGELRPDRAHDDMLETAEEIGLTPSEAAATIRSGWLAGERQPRQAPDVAPPPKDPDRQVMDLPAPDPTERVWVDWTVDEPPPPFYVWPYLPKNAYVMVYGPTEASKSMAWMGLLVAGSHRGIRSSVYSLENPSHMDRHRLRRWEPPPDPAYFRLSNDPLDFNDPRQLGALIEDEKAWGADVIMFDTYSHAFNSRSEDGNAKAIEFARRARHVMRQVGCSIVLVDHTGYENKDEMRDASAKRQQADVAILMTGTGVEWRPGQPSGFWMKNRKSARFANPFNVKGAIHDTKAGGLDLRWEAGDKPQWPN